MAQHDTRAHSELGASSCSRWWNCPGSVALTRGVPNPSSEHSRKGTAAHEVAEDCLRGGGAASMHAGTVRVVDGHEVEITEDMSDNVQVYLDACRAKMAGTGTKWWIEVRFDLSPLKPPVPMFGTADFVCYSPVSRTAWIIDYKNGYLHVSEETPQLKYYAIGAALWLGRDNPVQRVVVGVVQPNGAGEPVRWCEYTVAELSAWASVMLARAHATQEPDAPLQAGPWCQFCPSRGTCPQRAEQALAVAGIEFDRFLVTQEATPSEVRLLTPAHLSALLHKLDLLEQWARDARALGMSLLEQDANALPGWKRVPKRPVRSFADETAAIAVLEERGVSPYRDPELLSPAQAETALEPHMPGATKKARLEAAKAVLATHVQSVSSGATLAPESDPRPALPASGDEFTHLLQ